MSFSLRMQNVIDYIEEHLAEEINYSDLAKVAGSSANSFQRFFSYAIDLSLSDYIRRRRLSEAALELLNSNIKVLDLAIKYGYGSSIAFTRAFSELHGSTPTEVRSGSTVNYYHKLHFELSVHGDQKLNYKIEHKTQLHMLGIETKVSRDNRANIAKMPELWRDLSEECDTLRNISCEGGILYGLTSDYTLGNFLYTVATLIDCGCDCSNTRDIIKKNDKRNNSNNSNNSGCFTDIVIPESDLVIFECEGSVPESQYGMWRRIFKEWLPFTPYELRDTPQVEKYPEGDVYSQSYLSEIWLPVAPE